jgi:membrane carboxypeptidase/penicillin-binding protein PbpC
MTTDILHFALKERIISMKDEAFKQVIAKLQDDAWPWSEESERIARIAFDCGYSKGFQDGCAAGVQNTAQTQEFVYEALGLNRG